VSNILFVWELGANLGHLTRDLPLARYCHAVGHEVAWAVNDLDASTRLLSKEGFTLLQAPKLQPAGRLPPPINFAAMLLSEGYADSSALATAIQSWLDLITAFKPDVLVYNHAPTALLAAYLAGIPVLLCGTGFEIPPDSPVLPSFRPWLRISMAEHHKSEQQLLALVNGLLVRHGKALLPRLAALFTQYRPLLTTFSELDPFGPRKGGDYVGPVYALPEAPSTAWSSESEQKVLAYLRPTIPGVEALLHSLNELDAEVICAVPGLPEHWPVRYGKLHFFPHALPLEPLLSGANLMISYGATTMGTALRAGVPVLLVPQVIEQFLSGLPLERLGAGRMLREQRSPAACSSILKDMLEHDRYRTTARVFSEWHVHHTVDWGLDQLKQRLHILLAQSR
jgi:UDP:flavonoid glycosyltransferase YjiC (YdhE family)